MRTYFFLLLKTTKKNHQNVLLIFFSLQMIRSLLDRHVLLCFLLHPCYMMLSTFIRLTALLRQGLITVNFSIVADQALQGWAVTSRDGVSLCLWRSPLLSERPRVLGTALPWFKSKGVTMGDRCQAPGALWVQEAMSLLWRNSVTARRNGMQTPKLHLEKDVIVPSKNSWVQQKQHETGIAWTAHGILVKVT